MKLKFYFVFLFIFNIWDLTRAETVCDESNSPLTEGNNGETGSLPWLGVLRVHIHKGKIFQTALTGILLVKSNFAIANSGDVSRVSKRALTTDSKAMFIAKDGTPHYFKIKDVMTHPEYEFETLAILELFVNVFSEENRILKPICWPGYMYNTSTELYAMGFTDENKLLEKVVHKIQYVTRPLCEEFYIRADFLKIQKSQESVPHYQCGYAINNTRNCEWENGMVFASNTTGFWTVIGFSLRGPSCKAPVRFLEIYPYLNWINIATDNIMSRYEKK